MKIGYARVSTGGGYSLNFGCGKVFTEKMIGARSDRPGLDEAMKFMRKGEVFVNRKSKFMNNNMRMDNG